MASDRIGELPRSGLMRRKPGATTRAARARDLGQWELAAGLYLEALERNPRKPGIWVQYGHALKESGELRDPDKLAQAEGAYRRAIALDPSAADPHLQLGHALKLRGKTEEAQAAYLRAFALDPSMPYPLQELSGLGWSEAQVAGLRGAVAPNSPSASSSNLAAAFGDDAVVDAPRLGSMRRKLSVLSRAGRARDAGQWELAAELYRKALQRNPRNAPIWVQYGHALKESGELRDPDKLTQAEVAYRTALSLNPGAADTHLQLGHVLKLQGKTKEARAAYLRAFALDPSSPFARQELGGQGWTEIHLAELGRLVSPTSAATVGDESVTADLGEKFSAAVGEEPIPVAGEPAGALDGLHGTTGEGSVQSSSVQSALLDVLTWQTEVELQAPSVVPIDPPLGIFVHIFYDELADEIANYLAQIDLSKRVYVSTDSEEKKKRVLSAFNKCGLDRVTQIVVVPNYGLDIAPFLVAFSDKLEEHDVCLKIHGKRSSQGSREFGDGWRSYLYHELMGDLPRVRSIVNAMLANPDLGALIPQHYPRTHLNMISIGENHDQMQRILSKIGIRLLPNQNIQYAVGSMFWFRGKALAGLANLGFDWLDFGHVGDQRDATLAHAMERCFLFFSSKAGMKWGFLPPFRIGPRMSRDEVIRLVRDSGLFDAAYYLKVNPEISKDGVDPLEHWVDHGYREWRNPSENFDLEFYTRLMPPQYPNPLVHYIVEGRARGLPTVRPSVPFPFDRS